MKAGQETLPHCCGVDDLGDWEYRNGYYSTVYKSGTGLFTATFINDNHNREAYEEMRREFKLLYQSPVKVNRNSGNRLFLCVFQWKEPRRPRNARPGERLPNL